MAEFKLNTPDSFKRSDGSIKDYAKVTDADGNMSIKQETHKVHPNKVRMDWFSYDGKLLTSDDDDVVKAHMFQCHVDGIPMELIRSVTFPPISYDGNNDYFVTIVADVLED